MATAVHQDGAPSAPCWRLRSMSRRLSWLCSNERAIHFWFSCRGRSRRQAQHHPDRLWRRTPAGEPTSILAISSMACVLLASNSRMVLSRSPSRKLPGQARPAQVVRRERKCGVPHSEAAGRWAHHFPVWRYTRTLAGKVLSSCTPIPTPNPRKGIKSPAWAKHAHAHASSPLPSPAT